MSIDDQLPKIITKLKVVVVRSGAKSRSLKLAVDKPDGRFLSIKVDITGYGIRTKPGYKVLKNLLIN